MFFLVLKASDAENAKRHVVCVCAFALVLPCCGSHPGGCCLVWWFGNEDLASFSGPGVPTDCCHLLHLRCSSARGARSPPGPAWGARVVHDRARRWCKQRDAVEVQVPCKPSSWYVLSACHVHGLCFSPWQARPGGGCLLRVSDRESCRIPAGR